MKIVSLLFFLCSMLYACSPPKKDAPACQAVDETIYLDSIVSINLYGGISINWNNEIGDIQRDSLFSTLNRYAKKDLIHIAEQITDTSQTNAVGCPSSLLLRKGDVSFAVLDKLINIPIADILDIQLDVFAAGCQFPFGYFEAVCGDRDRVKERVIRYLDHKDF